MNIDANLLYAEESSRIHLEKLGNARENLGLGARCLKGEVLPHPHFALGGGAKNETQGLVA